MTDAAAISQTQTSAVASRTPPPSARNDDTVAKPFGGMLNGMIQQAGRTRGRAENEFRDNPSKAGNTAKADNLQVIATLCSTEIRNSGAIGPIAILPGEPNDGPVSPGLPTDAVGPPPDPNPPCARDRAFADISPPQRSSNRKPAAAVDDVKESDELDPGSNIMPGPGIVAAPPPALPDPQRSVTEPEPTLRIAARGSAILRGQPATADSVQGIRQAAADGSEPKKSPADPVQSSLNAGLPAGSADAGLTRPTLAVPLDPTSRKDGPDIARASPDETTPDRPTIGGNAALTAAKRGGDRLQNAGTDALALLSDSTNAPGARTHESGSPNFATSPTLSSPSSSPSSSLATSAASHAAAASAEHVGAHVPVDQVIPVLIRMATAEAPDRVTVQLSPHDLGRLDIQIDRPLSGPAQVLLRVERPETLELLERDQSRLHEALNRAGIQAEQRAVTFELAGPAIAPAQSAEAPRDASDRQSPWQGASGNPAQPPAGDSASGQSNGQQASQRQSREKWPGVHASPTAGPPASGPDLPALWSAARHASIACIGINITA